MKNHLGRIAALVPSAWQRTTLRATFALAVIGLLLVPWARPLRAQAQADSWTIGQRELPPPAGASEALAKAIGAAPAPDVAASRKRAPQTEAAWLALQKASANAPLELLSQQLGVAIDTEEIEGVVVYRVTPKTKDPKHAKHLFLHLHGGAYVLNGGDSSPVEAAMISSIVGIEALSIDYRMPPNDPFPAAVEDVEKVYRHLLESRPANSILLGGTSAGGGLSLAAVHRFLAQGLEVPGAIYAGTPWADLTKTGDTLFTNQGIDRVLISYEGLLGDAALLYAGGHDLKDPQLSPVYGSFEGFPPTYLVTGTRDMFLSDTARTHRKLRAAGVEADLNVYEGISHAEYLMVLDSPESQQALEELGDFVAQHLP